ncbi:MAG: flagellar hook-associated protein FlgK [Phycisphaerales bacterium]
MSLNSAFQIGRSSLGASQIAIQTAGNNVANAATPGYSRQVLSLVPTPDQNAGPYFIGRGVQIGSIRRQVDSALQQRLYSSVSQQSLAQTNLRLLSTVEAALGELSDTDVGSQLSAFFNSWSNLANSPSDPARRSLVVQQGQALAGHLRQVRQALVDQRTQLDSDLGAAVNSADDLVGRIAALNAQIVISDNASGNANTLRDQRDVLVGQLAELVDITTVDQVDGSQDVLVGSTPIVLAGRSRGIQLRATSTGSAPALSVTTRDNNEVLSVTQGRIGSLLDNRTTLVSDTLTRLDALASQTIFQVNRAHAQGSGTTPRTSATGALSVGSTDLGVALNDPANATFAGLPFAAQNGSFEITVRNTATGTSETRRITIDLDGITAAGTPGFADDSSVNSIVAALGAIANVTASVNGSGQVQIDAASGYELSFSNDSSGVLAVLGVNTYFTGRDATDIAIRPELVQTPGLLSSGRRDTAGQPIENGAARDIAAIRDLGLAALGGASLTSYWDDAVGAIATRTGAASTASAATGAVRESLEAQRSSLSGVNIDEEAINLITYQRQYQASARFISTVDEMTQILLTILR